MRFLLGVAEAGFFPGILLYFTYWFPSYHHARIVSGFLIGLPVAVMPASIPAVIMMRAIHSRAPTFSMIRLLGTSKMK